MPAKIFDLSLKNAQFNPGIAAQTYYWKGEALFRLNRFDEAIRTITGSCSPPVLLSLKNIIFPIITWDMHTLKIKITRMPSHGSEGT
jgi:hypothetical protein